MKDNAQPAAPSARLPARIAEALGSRKMGIWLRWFVSAIKLGYIIIQDRNPENDLVPLVPRDAQYRVIKAMLEQADAEVPVRLLIPKARREGISTLIQALGVFLCANIPRFKALTVAHTKEAAEEIFAIAKLIVDNMPDANVGSISAREIMFKNGSTYACTTAGGKGVKRGATIHFLHLSEVAEYQSVSDMDTRALNSLLNTVAMSPSTFVFMESTGAGPTGQFFRRCMNAVQNGGTGTDGYRVCFLPWFYDEENVAAPIPGVSLDAYDEGLRAEFKLRDDQLWFYKRKQQEALSGGDKEFYFRREYPSRIMESFTGASGLVYGSFTDRNICAIPLERLRAKDRPGKPREFYRGVDWGQTIDPLVCLWASHDPESDPLLTIDPSCKRLLNEMMSYSYDEKKDYPRDEHNHGPDVIRMLVATYGLEGHLHVYRELYVDNAAGYGLDGCARMIHLASGWRLPGLSEDESKRSDEKDLTRFQPHDQIGEMYDGTVADRSQPMMISMMTRYGLPMIPHTKPHPQNQRRTELLDGIALVNRLVIGASYLTVNRPDPVMTTLESAIDKVTGGGTGRQRRLTEEEQRVLEAHARDALIVRGEFSERTSNDWIYG